MNRMQLPNMRIILALAFALCGSLRAANEPASTISVPGTIEAFEASDQYAKDSGYVAEVKVDIGDHVSKGQVLVVIDDPELTKQAESARATLAARKEMTKAAEAAVQQIQKAMEVTQSQLEVYKADLELANVTLKRQEELYAGKAVTEQQIDEARVKARAAQAQETVGEAKVAMAQADVRSAEANRAVAEAQIAVADAEAQRLASLLEYTSIKAPFDGIVTKRLVNRGDLLMVSRATQLLTVQRIDTVRIFCDVPEASAGGIANGSPATIKMYGTSGQNIEAKVTRIAGALDPNTRTMRVEIDLPNPQEKLRPGMYAQVTLTVHAPTSVADAPAKP